LLVHNKIDLNAELRARVEVGDNGKPAAVWASAHRGTASAAVPKLWKSMVFRDTRHERVSVPPEAARIRAFLYERAVVLSEEFDDRGGWLLEVDIDDAQWGRLGRFHEFGQCRVAGAGGMGRGPTDVPYSGAQFRRAIGASDLLKSQFRSFLD
jgi:50S ribosomal subunit-associated GTPase HflX